MVAILLFIIWVNILPPLASLFFNRLYSWPLDFGVCGPDGQPLLGPHKSWRGLLASLAGGAALAPLLGWSWQLGLAASALAMAGDLLTSLGKRRFKLASGRVVPLVDHLLESLLPALFLGARLQLAWWQVGLACLLFIVLASGGVRLWHALIFKPSPKNSPRLVRSPVRYREWRACHEPLARWQTMLNLTSLLSNQVVLAPLFKAAGLYERGLANTLAPEVTPRHFSCPGLPKSFAGLRILLLTDLHLDGVTGLGEVMGRQLSGLEVDLCLVGGDLRMKTYGAMAPCLRELKELLPQIKSRHGIFAVLGNHDCIEMVPELEDCGLTMLVNDNWCLEEDGERLWLVGLDDPHYYMVDNVPLAMRQVGQGEFSIVLAHSPEAYRGAAAHGANLYLCGHTHGGQICLPGGRPLLTNSRAPRYTAKGHWRFQNMQGYTSRGAGASGVPLRFNCPGELTLITLQDA
ncbi:MAG: CDP-archaeol synthase [Thermodesulfobacteriota bacterium]